MGQGVNDNIGKNYDSTDLKCCNICENYRKTRKALEYRGGYIKRVDGNIQGREYRKGLY